MTKILIAIAMCMLGILTLPARAADLPLPPAGEVPTLVPGIVFSWTGFYVGGNVGYAWATTKPSATGPGISGSASGTLNGVIGGGQIGFNWQINSLVVGLESDFQASNQNGSVLYAGITETDKVPWFGTTRLRLGYAIDRVLLYGTGGTGYGEITRSLSGAVNGSLSRTTVGWTAGGGIEVAMNKNWSAKLEYLYFDLRDASSAIGKVTANSGYTSSILRIGVNYKIGGP